MKRIFAIFSIAMLISSVLIAGPIGDILWSVETGGIIHSSPAIGADGTIYIGSDDGCLYAINSDGSEKWKFETMGDVISSPAVADDGTVYIGSKDGRIYAINPDGIEKWHYQTGGKITASPAVGSDGTVYIGSRDSFFYAFNSDGLLKWAYDTKGSIFSSPAISQDGTVYTASDSDLLLAFNPDGSEKWTFDLYRSDQTGSSKLKVKSSPVLAEDGTIYIHSSYNEFYAINPDGSLKWEQELFEHIIQTPVISRNGDIYFVDNYWYGSNMLALQSDGSLKWCTSFQDSDVHGGYSFQPWCSPVVGRDGSIYFFYRHARFYNNLYEELWVCAYNPDGAFVQEIRFPRISPRNVYGSQLGSPVIDENGVMYFGWVDHKLYAIQTQSYGMAYSSWPCFGQNLQSTYRDDGIYGPVVETDEESPEVAFEDSNNDNDVILSAVEDLSALPKTFALSQNYPNPFNNQTQIQYQLPQSAYISLKIFNTVGKEVQNLVDEVQASGVYHVHWNGVDQLGNHVPSGMYFMELKAGDYREMRKMLLVE